MKPFRFGIINEQMKSPQAWVQHVQRIESLGFSTFLIRDHFVPDFFGEQYAPLSALIMAASVTTTLRIGTMVIGNDYRHPAILAKEIATIDAFSGGRFEFGLGAGWLKPEYEQAGMSYDKNGVRVSRLEEAIAVYKGLFADEPFYHQGEFYCIDGLHIKPQSIQQPHPPLLVGAGKLRMLKLAGREADIVGMLTTSVSSGVVDTDPSERFSDSVKQKLAWVKEGAGSRFDQLELSLIPSVVITDSPQSTAQKLIERNRWQGVTVEQVLEMPAVFMGTVGDVARSMIERRQQYGFSYYVFSDKDIETVIPIIEKLRND